MNRILCVVAALLAIAGSAFAGAQIVATMTLPTGETHTVELWADDTTQTAGANVDGAPVEDMLPASPVTPPEAPALPALPVEPPSVGETPGVPSVPTIPGAPELPAVPALPGDPGLPVAPTVPTTPELPATPDPNAPPTLPTLPSDPTVPTAPELPTDVPAPDPGLDPLSGVTNIALSTTRLVVGMIEDAVSDIPNP